MSNKFVKKKPDRSNPVAKQLGRTVNHSHNEKCEALEDFVFCKSSEYEVQYWNRLNTLLITQFTYQEIENEYLDEVEVSRMLRNYGKICFFLDDITGELLALPCEILRVSIANKPTVVKVWSPWLTEFQRVLHAGRDEFCVVWDSVNKWNVQTYFFPWIKELAEISITIDVNLQALRTPVVMSSSLENKLSLNNLMWQILAGIPFLNVKKSAQDPQWDIAKDLRVLDLKVPYNVDKLEVERKNIWNGILEEVGYKVNVNSTKKERLISSEVQGNLEETLGFYEARLISRLRGLKWLQQHGFSNAALREVTKVGEIYDNSEDNSGRTLDDAGKRIDDSETE